MAKTPHSLTVKGIEFSGELYDFLSNDMSRLYPDLVAKTRMTLYDVAPQILGSFDSQLAFYAHKKFDRKGIHIKTGKFMVRDILYCILEVLL